MRWKTVSGMTHHGIVLGMYKHVLCSSTKTLDQSRAIDGKMLCLRGHHMLIIA